METEKIAYCTPFEGCTVGGRPNGLVEGPALLVALWVVAVGICCGLLILFIVNQYPGRHLTSLRPFLALLETPKHHKTQSHPCNAMSNILC